MPGQFLTSAERERWERFPRDLSPEDLANFFTLSGSDRAQIPTAARRRIGWASRSNCARSAIWGFVPTISPPSRRPRWRMWPSNSP